MSGTRRRPGAIPSWPRRSRRPRPAATMIEGGFAQQVVGPHRLCLLEPARLCRGRRLQHALAEDADSALGVNPTGNNSIKGVAPYWRLALAAAMGPQLARGRHLRHGRRDHSRAASPASAPITRPMSASIRSISSSPIVHSFSVQASWITENQNLTASHGMPWRRAIRHQFEQSLAQPERQGELLLRSDLWRRRWAFSASTAPAIPRSMAADRPIGNSSPNSTGWIAEARLHPVQSWRPGFLAVAQHEDRSAIHLLSRSSTARRPTTTATAATPTTTTRCSCSIGSRSEANRER